VRRRKKIYLAREAINRSPWLSKRAVAKHFGIARSTLYLYSKKSAKDKILLNQVLSILRDHPHYGARRIAWHMGRNQKLVRRIMRKYALKLHRRRKYPRKRLDEGRISSDIPNRIKGLCPISPSAVWTGDFTFLDFQERFIYLATVIDLYTREVVGHKIGLHHSAQLVIDALAEAKRKRAMPRIFHSDQGSEYDSVPCRAWLMAHRILPSQSKKSSPWENGHQESFFGRFKKELGDLRRFESIEDLVSAIHHQILYYNNKRIHSALRMTPYQKYEEARKQGLMSLIPTEKHLSTGVS